MSEQTQAKIEVESRSDESDELRSAVFYLFALVMAGVVFVATNSVQHSAYAFGAGLLFHHIDE
jgi:hypothetical protein